MTPCAFVCLRESAMTASTAGLLVPACPRSLSSLHVRTRHMLTCRELCAALSSAGCDCARVLGRLTCRFELSRHAATSRVVNRYLPRDTCRSNHLCRIATSPGKHATHHRDISGFFRAPSHSVLDCTSWTCCFGALNSRHHRSTVHSCIEMTRSTRARNTCHAPRVALQ